jgi:hypothetical protein
MRERRGSKASPFPGQRSTDQAELYQAKNHGGGGVAEFISSGAHS